MRNTFFSTLFCYILNHVVSLGQERKEVIECVLLLGQYVFHIVTWILGSLFRPESWWRVVCLVSFLHPERGRLLHATANVFLPRTKQKLLLPERASRGLWESQSLGGNKVCVLHIRTHFNSLLSYHVFEDCSLRWLRWCNFKLHISHLNGATFLSNCICQMSGRVEYM